ncbi:MAG: transaldolase [Miltoncostaeaceae bacterium]|jgi:transaldolase|nr:transaldolase [Miltoncostaeaceae bacterium]
MTRTPLDLLTELGQSVWLDDLSRELLAGSLSELAREDAVRGVTSNPTIFAKAMGGDSDRYDEQMRELVAAGHDVKETFLALAVADVVAACDVLRPWWDEGRGQHGWVSLEVDPNLAGDADATIAEAERIHALVDRPNLYVKVPATAAGLVAIEELIARGIRVNVTLIFSLTRYAEVAEAYLRGVERLAAAGGDPATVTSVASFFVSRVDTEADKRLEAAGADAGLQGRLAIANAKLAYQRYKEIFSGARWEALAERGANVQRCLWASTSTKDPRRSDVMYVETLIGPDTVNTMPLPTIRAFKDHGRAEPTLERDLDEARRVFELVAAAGVDYDDVCDVLERKGVESFIASYDEVLRALEARRAELSAV